VPGDHLKIRVPDAQGNLKTVEFTMAGIALEFPTAPKDAFLVANLAYVAQQTGNNRISFVLARATGDAGAAAADAQRALGVGWAVTDLSSVNARLANGITSVDLSALVLLDLLFAVGIGAVGVSLFLLAGLAERRRELATLVAIGAEPRQMRSSLAGEALVVGVAGIACGLLVGLLVGATLLQILAGVFDPPADTPSVPVLPIVALVGIVALAIAASLVIADRGLARQSVVAALRER
jgi:putative ABC transport system permease protein